MEQEVMMGPKFRRGQLKADGRLGEAEGYDFIPAQVIVDNLLRTGSDMRLTIGLKFRNPTTCEKPYDNVMAIRWLRDNRCNYVYEAFYNGDGFLHVNALSDGDLI